MPVPAEGKRQRRWAPKTRTGCKTCKIRRKKCDETKPACARCIKDKFPCDGYEASKVWVFEPSSEGSQWEESSMPNVWALPSRSPLTRGGEDKPVYQTSDKGGGVDINSIDKDEPYKCWHLIRRQISSSDFPMEPSSPWSLTLDQNYTQYFLSKTAPLLSSTRRWQNFWQRIVPQAAWDNSAVRHAMVAVSLTFDSYVSGTDHKAIILSRRNRAVRAFATEPSSSWEVGLIVCRLFSSMAQCNEDFASAMTHMKAGEKMLLEATLNGQHRSSEVVRLMAATFMGLFADSTIDFDIIKRFPPRERQAFRTLQSMCTEYARMLRRVTACHWEKTIATSTMGFLSVVFTMLNQALGSTMYPDILMFDTDDCLTPVWEIHDNLIREGELITLEKLKTTYRSLFDEVEAIFDAPLPETQPPDPFPMTCSGPINHNPGVAPIPLPPHHATSHHAWPTNASAYLLTASGLPATYRLTTHLRHRLRYFTENFLVQAHALEPRMTAGTFWLPNAFTPSSASEREEIIGNAFSGVEEEEDVMPAQPCRNPHCMHPVNCEEPYPWLEEEGVESRERREFYHEFVCQYRSGFML